MHSLFIVGFTAHQYHIYTRHFANKYANETEGIDKYLNYG